MVNKEIYLLLYIKIERIDWFLYALTLCNITYSVVIMVMVVLQTESCDYLFMHLLQTNKH